MLPTVEFRIPIAPSEGFYSQVRFFEAALRKFGGPLADAPITVVVGDCCDITEVRDSNRWSIGRNLSWIEVPHEICAQYGIHGTANWRLAMSVSDSDIVILSDADTVIVGDISEALKHVQGSIPAIAGHMAHLAPYVEPASNFVPGYEAAFWPELFHALGLESPRLLHRYSKDTGSLYPLSPPYFNLGFVVLNRAALDIFRREIFSFEDEIKSVLDTNMRCQLAMTIIGHRHNMNFGILPAQFNAANDAEHCTINKVEVDDIRVVHYLRTDEIDRSHVFQSKNVKDFLGRELSDPVNRKIQSLVRELESELCENFQESLTSR